MLKFCNHIPSYWQEVKVGEVAYVNLPNNKLDAMEPARATSGADLIKKIEERNPLITTIINKFETATRRYPLVDNDPNIFILVDENYRSQTGKYGGYGKFAIKMRRIVPAACYIGFTGTPLLKKEKNTLNMFGGLIHQYTIDDAVADEAVVPNNIDLKCRAYP